MNVLEVFLLVFVLFVGKVVKVYLDVLVVWWLGWLFLDFCVIYDVLVVVVVLRLDFCIFKEVFVFVIMGDGEVCGVMIIDRLEGVNLLELNC